VTIDELIDCYCAAWTDSDPADRSRLLDSVWGQDATYTDPAVANLEKAELLAHIAKLQMSRPGARVRRTTGIDEHHGVLRFGFAVVDQAGAILRHGIDIVFLDPSRTRIQRVIGFFGELGRSTDSP
jgi:hypothetical protein